MEYNKQNPEEDGISLGQLFKVLFGRKILLAIITVCILIVGSLVFKFGYNDGEKIYQASYEYSIQGINGGKYIDGSKFEYRDIILYSNLEQIKSSSSKYDSIKLDDMYNNNDITISYERTYVTIDGKETADVDKEFYVIAAKKQYFNSEAQAKDFINDVASLPLQKTLKLVKDMDYSTYLKMVDGAFAYEAQINYLSSQLSLLQIKYQTLINFYGDITLSNNKKLSNILAEMNVYFQNHKITSLTTEVEQYGYVKDNENVIYQLKLELKALKDEYDANSTKLTQLISQRQNLLDNAGTLQTVDLSAYNSQIIELTIKNEDINYNAKIIQRKLGLDDVGLSTADIDLDSSSLNKVSKEEIEAFEAKIESFKQKLITYTDEYEGFEQEVVEGYATVVFYSNSIIVEDGGMNMLLMVVVFFVLGLVVGCVVNLILDGKKLSPNYVEPVKLEQKPEKDENN